MKSFYSSFLSFLMLTLFATVTVGEQQNLQSWSDKIFREGRFVVLKEFDDEAVLDRETGLVWERVAGDSDGDGDVELDDVDTWIHASHGCFQKTTGGRMGWRLPTVIEFFSLMDAESTIGLPIGNPFLLVQRGSSRYWSSNIDFCESPEALVVFVDGRLNSADPLMQNFFWCVRGLSPGTEGGL